MESININKLNGMSEEIQPVIYKAMEGCSNGQRLVICLYLMSELPENNFHLNDIEKNLLQIFPAAVRTNFFPKDYADFQATCIRFYFNSETGAVNKRKLSEEDRLWVKVNRGYWKNTNLGNQYALNILKRSGVLIEKEGILASVHLNEKVLMKREYLGEKNADLNLQEFIYPEELDQNLALPEGIKKEILINAYERNSKARNLCINHFGCACSVCGFDFETVYGEAGKGYIHVHHLKPLSEVKQEYHVNPIEDLRPVCPNCHAMLHRRIPPYSINELKKIM